MRLILATVAAVTLAVPAAAQDRRAAEVADRLSDPMVQDGVAGAVSALAGIVLDTRVGPLARLADPRADIRPNDTLRDLKRRDDPHFEARLHDDVRRSVGLAGAVAGDVATMSGEFGHTVARLRAAIGPLAAMADAYRGDPIDDEDLDY